MNFTNLSTRSASTQLRVLVISLTLVVTLLMSVGFANQTPAFAFGPQQRPDECTESAELRVLLSRDLTTIAFPQIPTSVSGAKSALVKSGNCPQIHHVDNRLPSFTWKLETPQGSASRLENTTTLGVRFTPDRVGQYIVKLIACPQTCKLRLLSGHTPAGKPILEETEVGPVERAMTIDVPAEAQLPPLYTPTSLPSLSAATPPEHYADPRSHCGGSVGIGIGDSPQWFTTDVFNPATPLYRLVEGRVYHTLVSRKDHPASHNSNDTNAFVELDPPFRRLLVDDTAEDKRSLLPFGGIEVEWEEREWPEAFRPVTGDRISALGFHVIDCGHEKYTELHPPIAVAVHRPRAVVLPARVRFQDNDSQPQPTGGNVVVPGIVTDLWASLRGGQALDCETASVHQPVFTTLPNGVKFHGGLNDIDPSTSSCAAYSIAFEFVPGRQPVNATFSPEMLRFAQQLLVRAEDRKRIRDVVDTELFTFDRAIDERTRLIVGKRGDLDTWQEEATTAKLQQGMQSGNPEPMIKDLRKHVQELLGPKPTRSALPQKSGIPPTTVGG